MKNTCLFSILAFIFCLNSLFAQDIPSHIFDKKACGCGTLEEIKSAAVSVKLDKIRESFTLGNKPNSIAIGNINSLATIVDIKKAEDSIKEVITQLSAKDESKSRDWVIWKSALEKKMMTAVSKSKSDPAALAQYLPCLFAEEMHRHYLAHPEDNGLPAQKAVYQEANLAKLPNTEPQPTTEDLPKTDTAEAIATGSGTDEVDSETNGASFPYVWLLLILAVASNIFFYFQWEKAKKEAAQNAKQAEIKEIKLGAFEKNQEDAFLKVQSEKNQLEQRNQDLQAQINKRNLELEELQLLLAKSKESLVIDNDSANDLVRYLFAPTQDGVFYQNSIKEGQSSDTFYKLVLNSEDASEGRLYLIKDPALLARAESAPQDFILPACELQGKGKINPSSLQMTEGTARRDGSGWRITKKIVLRW